MLRVLALGAGVQSSTVAYMTQYGELQPFDHAIFADTGWEPAAVYEHLPSVTRALESVGTQVHIVSAGNIRDEHVDPQRPGLFIQKPKKHPEMLGKQRTTIPFFLKMPEGESRDSRGRGGIARRGCTPHYKIEPIERKVREVLGMKKGQRWPTEPVVSQSFGISYDELQRMKDPPRPAVVFDYPLVDRKMTRDDCHKWMALRGLSAPRSACIGCPYHTDHEWNLMKSEHPDEWDDAVDFEATMVARSRNGKLSLSGEPYLHAARKNLTQVELRDSGSMEECGGYCGV